MWHSGHTGGRLTMGKGGIHIKSIEQKIDGKSGTETEIIGVDDVSHQILWTNHFTKAQGWTHNTTIHPDIKSAISLENERRLSGGSGTKHINTRHCFVKETIKQGEMNVEHANQVVSTMKNETVVLERDDKVQEWATSSSIAARHGLETEKQWKVCMQMPTMQHPTKTHRRDSNKLCTE